ncbi:MAG: carbohydrate ABC transporter permease [Clostridia bacterium]|nr:carbohydrate ABC transporter permease [Clostridia bacterium]
MQKVTLKRKKRKLNIPSVLIYVFMTVLAFITVFPVLNLVGVSLSDAASVSSVIVFPRGFTLDAYAYVFQKSFLVRSFFISVARVIVGTAIQTVVTVFTAYALSKPDSLFRGRTVYAWFFFLAMIFDGGIIPFYMMVKQLNMLDSFFSLVIPSAVQVFNIILLLNFFKQLPKELEESAMLDGAGYALLLWKVIVPVAKPAIATGVIFGMVGHWNAWLDGMMFMKLPEDYPLQTYVQSVIAGGNVTSGVSDFSDKISDRNTQAALITVAMLPMVLSYPFMQKYFEKGLIVGSVKG